MRASLVTTAIRPLIDVIRIHVNTDRVATTDLADTSATATTVTREMTVKQTSMSAHLFLVSVESAKTKWTDLSAIVPAATREYFANPRSTFASQAPVYTANASRTTTAGPASAQKAMKGIRVKRRSTNVSRRHA
jgi:hypothetical protein